MDFISQITKNFSKKTDNSVLAHQRNSQFFTTELFKLLNAFSPDLIKEVFSLNDTSVFNPEVLSE